MLASRPEAARISSCACSARLRALLYRRDQLLPLLIRLRHLAMQLRSLALPPLVLPANILQFQRRFLLCRNGFFGLQPRGPEVLFLAAMFLLCSLQLARRGLQSIAPAQPAGLARLRQAPRCSSRLCRGRLRVDEAADLPAMITPSPRNTSPRRVTILPCAGNAADQPARSRARAHHQRIAQYKVHGCPHLRRPT